MSRNMPPGDLLRRAGRLYDSAIVDMRSPYAAERLEEARALAEEAVRVITGKLAELRRER